MEKETAAWSSIDALRLEIFALRRTLLHEDLRPKVLPADELDILESRVLALRTAVRAADCSETCINAVVEHELRPASVSLYNLIQIILMRARGASLGGEAPSSTVRQGRIKFPMPKAVLPSRAELEMLEARGAKFRALQQEQEGHLQEHEPVEEPVDAPPINTLAELLDECTLPHLVETLNDQELSLALLAAASVQGRPATLSLLKAHGVSSISERQAIAGALAKAHKRGRLPSSGEQPTKLPQPPTPLPMPAPLPAPPQQKVQPPRTTSIAPTCAPPHGVHVRRPDWAPTRAAEAPASTHLATRPDTRAAAWH